MPQSYRLHGAQMGKGFGGALPMYPRNEALDQTVLHRYAWCDPVPLDHAIFLDLSIAVLFDSVPMSGATRQENTQLGDPIQLAYKACAAEISLIQRPIVRAEVGGEIKPPGLSSFFGCSRHKVVEPSLVKLWWDCCQ